MADLLLCFVFIPDFPIGLNCNFFIMTLWLYDFGHQQ